MLFKLDEHLVIVLWISLLHHLLNGDGFCIEGAILLSDVLVSWEPTQNGPHF